jgi:hypothetical protein
METHLKQLLSETQIFINNSPQVQFTDKETRKLADIESKLHGLVIN